MLHKEVLNMDAAELIEQANRIRNSAAPAMGLLAEAKEFLRIHAGEKTAFYTQIDYLKIGMQTHYVIERVREILEAFIRYVESGLLQGTSIQRRTQIDVVSDFLDQADTLLDSKEVHAAAPTVIIGAALEEFLRNWIEEVGLELKGQKPSLDSYKNVLRDAQLITKQDSKDITACGGLRNHAAHGEWEEVEDKNRISIMLEGVNLFMRKYTSPIS
jgi:hypothetical protein